MFEPSDEHFRVFAQTLSAKIEVYGNVSYTDEAFVASQKQQVELLDSLETQFRETLIESERGKAIYEAFISLIRDTKKNILDARPFFRERQEIFTQSISKALQSRSAFDLYPFHFNYHFVEFAINGNGLGVALLPSLHRIYQEIKDIRQKLIEINTPLAIARATQFYKKTPRNHMTRMDLIQVALEGLISGIDKFVCPYDNNTYRHMIIGRITGNLIESYCLDQDTMLVPYGESPRPIKSFKRGDRIAAVDELGQPIVTEVVALHDHGTMEGFEVCFNDGYQTVCSKNHKFLTHQGMVSLQDIAAFNLEVLCEPTTQKEWMANSLSASVLDQGRMAIPQKGMYDLPLDSAGCQSGDNESGKKLKGPEETGRLENSMWNNLKYSSGTGEAHGKLRPVSSDLESSFKPKSNKLEKRQPRQSEGELCLGESRVHSTTTKQSRTGQGALGQSEGSLKPLAKGKPGSIQREHQTGMVSTKTIQDGSLDEIQWDLNLGFCPDSVWGSAQTSRLCVPGSQDMDRNGRGVSLCGYSKAASRKNQTTGRYFKNRSSSAAGRNVNPYKLSMLQSAKQSARHEARMAGVAYANAPLTQTGGLVSRTIVRIRPVGVRRMYDLEVAHGKHNFTLPNGVVTSNSETAIHFFPSDKRKLYNANKALRGCEDVEDFSEIAGKVNELAKQEHYKTNPEEIRNLLAATYSTSTDAPVTGNGTIKNPIESDATRYSSRLACDESHRPDVAYEQQEVISKLGTAIATLTVFEQKVLRLKGISNETFYSK